MSTIVLHHTTGPNSLTADDIARYQTGPASPVAYPEIAYHDTILEDGTIVCCHRAQVLSWHCGSGSDWSKQDDAGYTVGGNNWTSYGIAFCGETPTPEQIRSMAWRVRDVDRQLGRDLERLPHRTISKGLTECPGDDYLDWWGKIV